MTVPLPPFVPNRGYYIYGYERTTDGENIVFPRLEGQIQEDQPEEPRVVRVVDGGGYNIDGNYVPHPAPKRVRLRGDVYAALGDAYLDNLLEITAGPGRLWRVRAGGAQHYSPCVRLTAVAMQLEAANFQSAIFPVSLEFELPTGLWYSRYLCPGGLYGYAKYGDSLYGGVAYAYFIGASPFSFTVPNDGTAICRAMIVRIVAPGGGGITGPIVVTNTATGHTFTIAGNLAAGSSYVLDTSVPSFKEDGIDDWANLTIGANQRNILWLAPRNNAFVLTHGGVVGAGNYIEFEFYNPYY